MNKTLSVILVLAVAMKVSAMTSTITLGAVGYSYDGFKAISFANHSTYDDKRECKSITHCKVYRALSDGDDRYGSNTECTCESCDPGFWYNGLECTACHKDAATCWAPFELFLEARYCNKGDK
jgi:hypothetical protein